MSNFAVRYIETGEVSIVHTMDGHDDPNVWEVLSIEPPEKDSAVVFENGAFIPAPPPPLSRLDAFIALMLSKGVILTNEVEALPLV